MSAAPTGVDPITYQVIRNRLGAIVDQQSAVLKSVSGSPVVTDANDCNTGIYLPHGEIVAMGPHVMFHAGSMSLVIGHILADCSDDPGIDEGDVFVTSDPYKGALHLPDVTVLEPVFHDGTCVAWVGACAHELDVGGMVRSSWCTQATDYHQEGLILPPTKLVEGGRVRRDVWELILGNTRLPVNVGLDLKAMIAANARGRDGLVDLIGRYGVTTVTAVMSTMLDRSEQSLRERLCELPDGRFRARTYLDHDGHANRLYTIALELTKRGDELIFDYSGSSPQAPGFVNCTESGLRGGVMSGLFPVLCHDIQWNGGALRPVSVVAPVGTIVNARRPAPCSGAPTGATFLVEAVAAEALSRLVACSPKHAGEAMATTTAAAGITHVGGVNQYGEPFGGALTDALMGGGGATIARRGIDYGGPHQIIRYKVPNVENGESTYPMLYLRHSANRDSGGPGRYRGGLSGSIAWTTHGSGAMHVVQAAHGVEVPCTSGLFGGHPASCHRFTLVRDSDLLTRLERGEPITAADQVDGEVQLLAGKPGQLHVHPGDVFEATWHGGGGFGDPVDAEPAAVVADVEDEAVSLDTAARVYGVVLDAAGGVDVAATDDRRAAIRAERRSWASPAPAPGFRRSAPDATVVARLGERLAIVRTDAGHAIRCDCGEALCPADVNYKDHVASATAGPGDLGPYVKFHEEIEVRRYACPACGSQLAVETQRRGTEPLHEAQLDGLD